MKGSKTPTPLIIAVAAVCLIIGYLFIRILSIGSAQTPATVSPETVNLWTIFLTGLLTGGLTCLAVQGGLLAATIAQREEEKLKDKLKKSGNVLPILAFLLTKLIAYTGLGFLLGWFGSLFQLSITTQIIMQVIVAIFMIGTALNIFNVHPVFRYFVIQPPKSLTRIVRNQSKNKSLFAPALLGAFTVLIPCGTTQAMMALAIGSANPFVGAAILFLFVLGTSPLFFALGYFAFKLGETLHRRFMRFAALTLIILAMFNLNNALALTGFSFPKFNMDSGGQTTSNSIPQTNVTIDILDTGYTPNSINVKAGSNVTFTIKNDGAYGCAAAFTIPYFNYQKIMRVGTEDTIALRMPDKPTQIPFMCSMGMYRGVINVI